MSGCEQLPAGVGQWGWSRVGLLEHTGGRRIQRTHCPVTAQETSNLTTRMSWSPQTSVSEKMNVETFLPYVSKQLYPLWLRVYSSSTLILTFTDVTNGKFCFTADFTLSFCFTLSNVCKHRCDEEVWVMLQWWAVAVDLWYFLCCCSCFAPII